MNLEYIYLPSGVVTKQTFNIEVICTSRTAAASDLILNRCDVSPNAACLKKLSVSLHYSVSSSDIEHSSQTFMAGGTVQMVTWKQRDLSHSMLMMRIDFHMLVVFPLTVVSWSASPLLSPLAGLIDSLLQSWYLQRTAREQWPLCALFSGPTLHCQVH